MKTDPIIDELKERIDEDLFDDLEEKLETLQLLADFESARDMRECSLCSLPGSQGRMLDECTGADMGRCEHCKGIGFIPLG
jgi:hypothetical protein